MSKFSVLTSIYIKDNPIFFRQALDSLIKQTLMPNEIVIVKDGELTDEMESILKEYTSKYQGLFKILALKRNVGLGLALQAGLNECKYDIVARMDSDDVSHKDRFSKQIAFLKNNPDIAIVGTNAFDFTDNIEDIISKRIFPEHNKDIVNFSKQRCPFLHPTIMFRKDAVLKVGNYEHLLWFEDYLLFLKLIDSGFKGYNIQENLLYFRSNSDTFERRGGVKYLKQELIALRKFHKAGYYNFYYFLTNIFIRSGVRILGNNLRRHIYNRFLRN